MFLVRTGREPRGLANDFALADVRRMTSPKDGQKRGWTSFPKDKR